MLDLWEGEQMRVARQLLTITITLGSLLLMGMEYDAISGLQQAESQTPTSRQYTVVRGDSLSKIAARFLGDPYRWPEIYALNRGQISDPNLIYPNQVFILPTDATSTGETVGSSSPQDTPSTVTGSAPASSDGGAVSAAASGGISTKSPQFATWLREGLKEAEKWKFFPSNLTNQYGEKITPACFVRAIMYIESRGIHQRADKPLTTSSCGAMGFMQLMPKTAEGLGVNARDPQGNLIGGIRYLGTCLTAPCSKVSGDTPMQRMIKAACGYNTGPYRGYLKENSWNQFVNEGKGNIAYGLLTKMAMGLSLTSSETSFMMRDKNLSAAGVADYARSFYSKSHGLF